jgi:hypothetical protein
MNKKKRLLWKFISLFPVFIRQKVVRSRYKLIYDIAPEIIFKVATTQDEIEQSLQLVYDSYIHQNYIDKNPDRLHLTKYLILPTSTILIIKKHEEVIGTMSILLDSSLGLPTETTWNIKEFKNNGKNIVEISALCIKKMDNIKSGELLLPLIKLMYLYSMNILKQDGLIAAFTHEVESFYTDLLLFKKIPDSHGQNHKLVKNNKSSCCYLELNDSIKNSYYKNYAHLKKNHNFYYYFFIHHTPNIQLPEKLNSVQAQLREKNINLLELLKKRPHIYLNHSKTDKLIISNLDPKKQFSTLEEKSLSDRRYPRLVTMINSYLKRDNINIAIPIKITEISECGLKITLNRNEINLGVHDEIIIKLEGLYFNQNIKAKVVWIGHNQQLGCEIMAQSLTLWNQLYQSIWNELQDSANVA